MTQVDVTGERFDFVECAEGNIFFDNFAEGEKFTIKVYGATLIPHIEQFDKKIV